MVLFDYYLLSLDIVAVDEAEHIDTRCGVHLDGGVAVEGLVADDAARHVDDMQLGVAFVVDDPFATVEVGEVFAAFFDTGGVLVYQLETAGIVGGVGLEGVTRVGKQVDVHARHVVDKVEVIHFNVVGIDAEGISAIVGSLETDRHLAFVVAADDGVVVISLFDIDLGVVGAHHGFRHLLAFAKANHGAVDDTTVVGDVEDKLFARCGRLFGSEDSLVVVGAFSHDEDALHGVDGRLFAGKHEIVTVFVHDIIVVVDGSGHTEGVADEIPAFEVGVLVVNQVDFAVAVIGLTFKGECGVGLTGIEVTLA